MKSNNRSRSRSRSRSREGCSIHTSNVLSSEEVAALTKILAVLLLLLVIAISIISTSSDMWSFSRLRGEGGHESLASPPPANLTDNITDDAALFRQALAVSDSRRDGSRTAAKIAFLFLSRGPLPLSSLWETYFAGHQGLFSIYIHSHPSYRGRYTPASVFSGRQIRSEVIKWGSLSMVDAERRLLANALLDPSNERFILLSETCIPLFNFTFTYRYLMTSERSFVDAFDDPGPGARGRYRPGLAPQITVDQWRKGAQWFEVGRDAAAVIVNDTAYYSKFHELRGKMVLQDEHYIPTLLSIRAPELIAGRTITWAYWHGRPHPKTFGKGDVNGTLLERIKHEQNCTYNDRPSRICYLFARKFAASALEPLTKLMAATTAGSY